MSAQPATERRVGQHRRWTWIALTLFVACLGMVGFSLASLVLPGTERIPDRPDLWDFVSVLGALLAFPVVGAVVAVVRPRNPIGWLFLVIGLAFVVGIFGGEYAGRALYTDAQLPGASFAAWASAWCWMIAMGLSVSVTLLIFPDGHLPSPRWRPVLWAAYGCTAVASVSTALSPRALEESLDGRVDNPFALGGSAGLVAETAAELTFPAMVLLGLLSLASLVVRFRRSRTVERQQLKWFLSGGAILLVGIVTSFVTMVEPAWYLAMLGLASLPIAAGVAILRYRLYDIDRIISRTVSYGVLSALLGLTFAGLVLGIQTVLGGLTEGDTLAVAASTLAVFALSAPLRRRTQRAVDRRFNRARIDAEATSVRFAERLRDELDLPTIRAELARAAGEALSPAAAGTWLRVGDRPTDERR